MAGILFYHDLGQDKRGFPTVVMIHGDFSDGEGTWGNQMASASLSARCRLIVVDRRGAGKSPVHPRPYTIHGEALDVLALLDHAGVDRCHVAGHSYGGLIAYELTRIAGARVQSLHLIEPPYLSILPDDPDVSSLRDATAEVAQQAPVRSAEEITAAFFAALMGEEAVRRIREKPVWASLVREAKRYGYQQPPASYPAEHLTGRPAVTKMPPVVLYTGGRSHPALQKVTCRLATLLPGSRLVLVAEAGHSVQHAGDTFERLLLEYIERPG